MYNLDILLTGVCMELSETDRINVATIKQLIDSKGECTDQEILDTLGLLVVDLAFKRAIIEVINTGDYDLPTTSSYRLRT